MAILNRGPNVYIDEIPSGVHSIAGVSTSVAAFIDFFPRGDMNVARRILDFGQFIREYGGLHPLSEASYGIQQFFQNGGSEAWVVRTASGVFGAARVEIASAIAGASTLRVRAIDPGQWGNRLRVVVDPATATTFNLGVQLIERRNGEDVAVQSETFLDLTMVAGPRLASSIVNDPFTGSHLVRLEVLAAALPQPVGTLSGPLAALNLTNAAPRVDVTIGIEGTGTAALAGWTNPGTLAQARAALEAAIRAARPESPAFARATVSVVGNRLRIQAGPTANDARVLFAAGGVDATTATLQLGGAPQHNGLVSSADIAGLPAADYTGLMRVTIGANGPHVLNIAANSPATVRAALETALRAADAAPEFANARVALHAEGAARRLVVLPGTAAAPAPAFTAEAAGNNLETKLRLDTGLQSPVTLTGNLAGAAPAINAGSTTQVTIGAVTANATTAALANTYAAIGAELQNAIRAANPGPAFTGARVAVYSAGENRFLVWAGAAATAVTFAPAPGDATTVNELGLAAGVAAANVQYYALGVAAPPPNTAQGAGVAGGDGVPPDGNALIGNLAAKTGMYALEDVDLFNILCIPRTAMRSGANAITAVDGDNVIVNAKQYCRDRRAFFIVDTPTDRNTFEGVQAWLTASPGLRDHNYAVYFPRVQVLDPLDNNRMRSIGASGTMAGVYARVDASRGVWKAPAGIEATLDVSGLDYRLTDLESGVLNPMGINCLRTFRASGHHAWGARTLRGVDAPASEWKYIPVRRLALFLEESLFRGTTWVLFEGNDEPLWAKIRLNVRAFMMQLFRQGAFQGSTPDQAFFVKCDAETTTQADRNLGIVNIDVGFAPLKPAEFVVIRIRQMPGDL